MALSNLNFNFQTWSKCKKLKTTHRKKNYWVSLWSELIGCLTSLSPRTSHHSECTKHKASFFWLWALLGTLVCSVQRQSIGDFSLTLQDRKESKKGAPPKRQTGLCSRKFTWRFSSSFYASMGLVPCLDWEITNVNTYLIIPWAF